MYIHRIAYRHHNGEVEGFVGYGFDSDLARRNAIRKINDKLHLIKISGIDVYFNESQVISDPSQCTKEEFKQIKEDWNIEEGNK